MSGQTVQLWLAVVALLVLSVLGFQGILQEWSFADSFGQQFSAFLQAAYALLGLAAAAALVLKSRWSRSALYLWAAAMILTGATAPVVWGGAGEWAGLAAAAVTAVIAGAVIWLAPLPAATAAFSRWRWLAAAVYFLAAFLVVYLGVHYGPLAVAGKEMEGFCYHVQGGLTEQQLQAQAEQRGYIGHPGTDVHGRYLRIEDTRSHGHYSCEARFQDGRLHSISFTARARD